jgi:acyl-CoA synthetase (AMP-forming)/AMP-acid ligase II
MVAWNFASIWEIAADNVGHAGAVTQRQRRVTWADFDRRADGLAASLLEAGAVQQDKVALYLYNCAEYLEANYACFKAGLVPVNTNYRYADDELAYLWDNADAVSVIFHSSFTERVERARARVPGVRTWLWVDDGAGECPPWATPYEAVATNPPPDRVMAPWGRGPDDLLMIYTGGTTGMPKGVMWRQDDLVRGVIGATAKRFRGAADYDGLRSLLNREGKVGLPACPLMHGTGWFSSLAVLSTAGCVALLSGRKFDAEELLDTYEREGVNVSAIVGDAQAKPILAALDASPGRWDLSSLAALNSSGVMWSAPVKERLLVHMPHVRLIDNFGSSEAMGMAQSVTTTDASSATARFAVSAHTRVIDEEGRDVVPGSGQIGRVAVRGHQPIGYYKDPDKSAQTFVTIGDDRYSIPGDYASVDADGALVLLGRGSVCVNTGGEKVFPEEVEEVLKLHSSVRDAVVVGVPDDRFGEAVTGIVELRTDDGFDQAALVAHVKERLAAYKAPRHIVVVGTIGRSPNGKVDYKRLRDLAVAQTATGAGGR